MKLGRVGLIGRWKPLHNGGAVLLETLCENAEHVVIGIGSANKYNARCPFTAEETQGMIDAFLSPRFANYSFKVINDYGHIPEYRDGLRWRDDVLKEFGYLDFFVSGNSYVSDLLKTEYEVLQAPLLIPKEKRIYMKGTIVRMEMARGGDWKACVPKEAADYLESNGLVERFRQEFGLETLASCATDYWKREDVAKEKANVQGDGA